MSEPVDAVISIPEKVAKESVVITGKELLQIFRSEDFVSAVNNLAKKSKKAKYDSEGGFYIYRNIQNGQLEWVVETDVDAFNSGIGKKESEKIQKLYGSGYFPLISLHTHPLFDHAKNAAYAYTPSPADLQQIHVERQETDSSLQYDVLPVGIIIIIKGKGMIEMILYQETRNMITSPFLLNQYRKDIESNESIKDSLDLLEAYGYKALLVTFNSGKLTAQGEERLKSFGFEMIPLDSSPLEPDKVLSVPSILEPSVKQAA